MRRQEAEACLGRWYLPTPLFELEPHHYHYHAGVSCLLLKSHHMNARITDPHAHVWPLCWLWESKLTSSCLLQVFYPLYHLLRTLVLFFEQDLMETGLKLSMYLRNNPERRILLPLPSRYWEYRHRPLHLLYMVLGVDPGASCRLTHTFQPEKDLYLKFYAEF